MSFPSTIAKKNLDFFVKKDNHDDEFHAVAFPLKEPQDGSGSKPRVEWVEHIVSSLASHIHRAKSEGRSSGPGPDPDFVELEEKSDPLQTTDGLAAAAAAFIPKRDYPSLFDFAFECGPIARSRQHLV